MAHVAQMHTQEPIYKSSSIFCFKPILLSAHKLILLIYGDNKLMLLLLQIADPLACVLLPVLSRLDVLAQ